MRPRTATGGITLYKCLTTPQDPAEGALAGIRAITAEATDDEMRLSF